MAPNSLGRGKTQLGALRGHVAVECAGLDVHHEVHLLQNSTGFHQISLRFVRFLGVFVSILLQFGWKT